MSSVLSAWRRWILRSVLRFGWAPILVMGAHLVLSKLTRAYADFPDLDILMHFVGGVAIGYFFWRAVQSAEGAAVLGAQTLGGQAVATFGLAGSSTVIWEFAEWTTDRLGITHAQAGLPDTMLDMAMGFGGGLLVLAFGVLRR